MSKKQLKDAARATIAGATEVIASTLSYVDAERTAFETRIARFEVRIAMALAEGVAAHTVLHKGSKGRDAGRKWAAKVLPDRDDKTRSRWLNAGRVAIVLRGPAVTGDDGTVTYPDNLLARVPGALIGSLVPLYRIVSSARTDEAREKAETLLRETYQGLLDKAEEDEDEDGNTILVAPTMAEVLKAAEKVAPTNRGPKAESATDEDEDASEDEDEDEDGESRRESSESLVVVEAAKVEAASGPVGSILKQCETTYKVPRETVVGIMLAALRLGSEHGNGTIVAVLGTGGADADADAARDAA